MLAVAGKRRGGDAGGGATSHEHGHEAVQNSWCNQIYSKIIPFHAFILTQCIIYVTYIYMHIYVYIYVCVWCITYIKSINCRWTPLLLLFLLICFSDVPSPPPSHLQLGLHFFHTSSVALPAAGLSPALMVLSPKIPIERSQTAFQHSTTSQWPWIRHRWISFLFTLT